MGYKSAALRGFLVQRGKFLVVKNSFILNLCQIFEFWIMYLNFGYPLGRPSTRSATAHDSFLGPT